MDYTNLHTESDEYVRAREDLRLAEIALMEHREQVARMRRDLPPGPIVPDYEFTELISTVDADDDRTRFVALSELFAGDGRPLIVYHFMYGKLQSSPRPMCTMWIDGFNGIVDHVTQNADLVVVAAAEPTVLRDHARDRGWSNLRLLSAGSSTFKYDLGSEDAAGNQDARISVFTRDGDGIRHRYTGAPRLSEEIPERGIDLLCPTWHLLDLTPGGRGEWYSSLSYGP
jgi:predicted dithiol-disulfide oxidoreductase (DUF899 family)